MRLDELHGSGTEQTAVTVIEGRGILQSLEKSFQVALGTDPV